MTNTVLSLSDIYKTYVPIKKLGRVPSEKAALKIAKLQAKYNTDTALRDSFIEAIVKAGHNDHGDKGGLIVHIPHLQVRGRIDLNK